MSLSQPNWKSLYKKVAKIIISVAKPAQILAGNDPALVMSQIIGLHKYSFAGDENESNGAVCRSAWRVLQETGK